MTKGARGIATFGTVNKRDGALTLTNCKNHMSGETILREFFPSVLHLTTSRYSDFSERWLFSGVSLSIFNSRHTTTTRTITSCCHRIIFLFSVAPETSQHSKFFPEGNERFVSSTLHLPRSVTIPGYPLQRAHSHFNWGNTPAEVPCATERARDLQGTQTLSRLFSFDNAKALTSREEEYNFLNLAWQCLLRHRDIEREHLRWPAQPLALSLSLSLSIVCNIR